MMLRVIAQILIGFILLFLLQTIAITTSSHVKPKANRLIRHICETLQDDNSLHLGENEKWETLCHKLLTSKHHKQRDDKQDVAQNRQFEDEESMVHVIQPRKGGGRGGGGSRSGGSRFSSGSRTSSGSRSSSSSGSRISSSTSRFVSTRSGQRFSRPTGWMWSRSRYTFLPVSTLYTSRYHSSSNRYTTQSTGSITYYYCTSKVDTSNEIQCTTTTGDQQCCEDESSHQVYCCGGKIAEDLKATDGNQAAQILARVFYTLAALSLLMHVVIRRFFR